MPGSVITPFSRTKQYVYALHLALFACSVWAQSAANSGEIVGEIRDASSATLPIATVSVRNVNTNYRRVVKVDGAGRYALLDMPIGPYEVTAEAIGFAPATKKIYVTLGSSVSGLFRLAVASHTETVQVTAQDPGIEPTRSTPKTILTELQINELPSNGRRVQNNVLEVPGTLIEPECRGFSVSGQKGIYANVSVDGGDYNSTWGCGIRGRSESAPSFSLEAVQELQVVRNTFSAEFGRSTGGQINLSTRSGTNVFHGSAFDLERNSALAITDAFGRPTVSNIQQFGGSIGGPIVHDKTFFFSAPEFQYGSKPVQVLYATLDSQGLRSSPGAQALLSVAPESLLSAQSKTQAVINRIDHRLSATNTLLARFDFTHTVQINSPGSSALSTGLGVAPVTGSTSNVALTSQFILPDTDLTALTQLTSQISSHYVNELRFQYSRELRPRSTQGNGPQVTVQSAGATVAQYGPPAALSSFGSLTYASTDNRYQAADNLSRVTGAHTTKTGLDLTYIAGTINFNGGNNGLYLFPSLSAYLARTPSQYQQFTGTGVLSINQTLFAAYVQHDWRFRHGLTFNGGLRYDEELNPNYLQPTAPAKRFPAATSIPNDLNMLAPRAGFAWDVQQDGKTVVRGGGGVFFAPTFLSLLAQSILFNGGNPETAYSVNVTNATTLSRAFQSVGVNLATAPLDNLPVFTPAQASAALPASSSNVIYMDPSFRNPRATQGQFGVEHEFSRGISASTSFSYLNTVHVARQRDTNLGAPVTDATGRQIFANPRPNAAFGVGQVTESTARELYRGLTTAFNVRRSRYNFNAYYTLSWNLSSDDSERGISAIRYDNALKLGNEYAFSNIDERHQLLIDSVVYLPFHLEMGGTTRLTSGRPFTAVAGTDLNRDGQNTDRPIVNGQLVTRNTYRNTGFKDVSLRLQRNFTMPRERGVLSLSAEFFNAFNFSNVQIGASNMAYGAGTSVVNGAVTNQPPLSTFNQLRDGSGQYLQSNVAGDAFQAQLGARYRF